MRRIVCNRKEQKIEWVREEGVISQVSKWVKWQEVAKNLEAGASFKHLLYLTQLSCCVLCIFDPSPFPPDVHFVHSNRFGKVFCTKRENIVSNVDQSLWVSARSSMPCARLTAHRWAHRSTHRFRIKGKLLTLPIEIEVPADFAFRKFGKSWDLSQPQGWRWLSHLFCLFPINVQWTMCCLYCLS